MLFRSFAAKAEHVEPALERPVRVAENGKPRALSPVSDAAPDASIVQIAPQIVSAVAPPAAPPVADTPIVVKTAPAAAAALARNPFAAADREAEPVQTASVMPRALPDAVEERPLLFAPMVFEAPKPADAQVLTELPNTELVVAAPEPVVPKQAEKPVAARAPYQVASLAAGQSVAEFPKTVSVFLPVPKPPLTPAQRLELSGKDYDKAEKCLAQAIYFEARNESARGQQAVAQVVLNRVFSPYYPKDVCSVVYQNAHRHLSCQFTFACDGKPETVNERGAWVRANRIAKQTLDAKVWLPEVNKATHYHAAYVRPNWIRDMKVMVRYGLHTFYRPRNWGDGSNEAHWATPANSVKPAAAVAAKPAAPAARKLALRKT